MIKGRREARERKMMLQCGFGLGMEHGGGRKWIFGNICSSYRNRERDETSEKHRGACRRSTVRFLKLRVCVLRS